MKNEIDQTTIPVDTEKGLSIYWNMTEHEFKERLFTTTSNDQRRQIKVKQWLETDVTLLQFIKQHACLVGDFYLLTMELDLYKTYINMTQPETLWFSQISISVIKYNKICQNLFKIHTYIKKQLKMIDSQLQKSTQKVIKFVQQEEQQVSTLSIMDMNLLKAFISTFVRQDQQQLNGELDKKRHLLMLNMNDVRLVKEFFDLKPSPQQVVLLFIFHSYFKHCFSLSLLLLFQKDIAGRIWQATVKEQRAKKDIQYAEQCMITNEADLAIKEHFFTDQITEAKMMAESNAQMIEDNKRMFLAISQQQQQQQENEKDPVLAIQSKLNSDLLMNIIESRRRILIQRIQFNRDFNKIFFNEDRDDDSDNDDENSAHNSNSDINDSIETMNASDDNNWNDDMYID